MVEAMGADLFDEWMAFEMIEPWGAQVEDRRAGQIVYAASRGKIKPADAFPGYYRTYLQRRDPAWILAQHVAAFSNNANINFVKREKPIGN